MLHTPVLGALSSVLIFMFRADRNIDTHGPLLSALLLHIIAHDIFCVSAFMKVFVILTSSVKIFHPEHSTVHIEQSKKK